MYIYIYIYFQLFNTVTREQPHRTFNNSNFKMKCDSAIGHLIKTPECAKNVFRR